MQCRQDKAGWLASGTGGGNIATRVGGSVPGGIPGRHARAGAPCIPSQQQEDRHEPCLLAGCAVAAVGVRRRWKQLERGNSPLARELTRSYPREVECARKVAAVVELRFDTELTEDEIAYLALHVARLSAYHQM